MKNLFDILLDNIINSEKEAEKEAAKARKKAKKNSNEGKENEEEAKANTLAEQAEAEVKRRAKKKLEEAFKKSEAQMADIIAKNKRRKREAERSVREQDGRKAFEDSLVAPTANLQWKVSQGNIHHLHAFIGEEHAFDIKRGVASYTLYLMDTRLKGRPNLKERAKQVGVGNIFSSINVYALKHKAEKILAQIQSLEKQAIDKAKKQKG